MQERDKFGRFKAKRGKVFHSEFNKWSDESVKVEYNRLRSIALKRNKRAMKSSNVKPLKLPTANQLGDIKKVRIKVEQLSDEINRSTSTVLGKKQMIKKSVDTFNDKGFKFLTTKNYESFGDFMKAMRAEYEITEGTMSERVVEMYNIKKEYRLSEEKIIKNFNLFLNNTSKLSKQLSDTEKGIAEVSNRKFVNNLIEKAKENEESYTLKATRKPKDDRRNKKKKKH